MTRKDYILVSEALREAGDDTQATAATKLGRYVALATIEFTAEKIAEKFSEDSPRFERERFISACGLTNH